MCSITGIFAIALSPIAAIAAIFNGFWRLKHGESNIHERLGLWGKTPSNVIWMHGASVGECLSLRPLLTALNQKTSRSILVTTTTVAARSVMSKIHPHVKHQVWDIGPLVLLRIKLSQPIVYITVESEIWPVWFWTLNRCGVPIILLNARLSERSIKRWKMFPWLARSVFKTISYATTSCEERADFLRSMGVKQVEIQPHLKYLSDPMVVDEVKLEKFQKATAGRPLWMAASVHPGEREAIINAMKKAPSGTLTIIAPRHIHTVEDWCNELTNEGFKGLRYKEFKEGMDHDVHYLIIDSMGELPLFYSLCPVVMVGGNLVPGIGGHNIIEPGMFGCAVIWGPHVDNCLDVCRDLADYGFAVNSASELATTVQYLLTQPEIAREKGQDMKKKLAEQRHNLQSWAHAWVDRILLTKETK